MAPKERKPKAENDHNTTVFDPIKKTKPSKKAKVAKSTEETIVTVAPTTPPATTPIDDRYSPTKIKAAILLSTMSNGARALFGGRSTKGSVADALKSVVPPAPQPELSPYSKAVDKATANHVPLNNEAVRRRLFTTEQIDNVTQKVVKARQKVADARQNAMQDKKEGKSPTDIGVPLLAVYGRNKVKISIVPNTASVAPKSSGHAVYELGKFNAIAKDTVASKTSSKLAKK